MIRLELVTLTGIKFNEDVYEVTLPTLDGQIGVLDHHMPLISVATNGVIEVRRKSNDPDSKKEYFATNGGAIEVFDNVLRVLVDEADNPEEINEAEARDAVKLAEKMKHEAKDDIELEQAQDLIDRSTVRLRVAELRRRKNY
jgi:F-type H+-transporting ATPase subunit epsilon